MSSQTPEGFQDTGNLEARTLISNAIEHYYDPLQVFMHSQEKLSKDGDFTPGWDLPKLDPDLIHFFSVSDVSLTPLNSPNDTDFRLLNLSLNPDTQTTKTFASLITVARVVHFMRAAGRKVTIVTPSSANKAIAMRDAILRAYECGLSDPEHLNVVSVVPRGALSKMRRSALSDSPYLSQRNPVIVFNGTDPSGVKDLARQAVMLANERRKSSSSIVWYSLDLKNYIVGDVLRAFVEAELFPLSDGVARTHVHAVSSAFGLIGHCYGWEATDPVAAKRLHYLLVQHLAAPDMVLGLTPGSARPEYTYESNRGLYEQHQDARFPYEAIDPYEVIDPTFYTRQPTTIPFMRDRIATYGGSGIVVSLTECLKRYAKIRQMLSGSRMELPADPRGLREWSLVMALTGALNATERGLLQDQQVVVHGSGSYATNDYEPIQTSMTIPAMTPELLAYLICQSAE